jgi:hypothetical protein
MQPKKGGQGYYIAPKTITNQMPPTNRTETIPTTHTHQNPNNHKTSKIIKKYGTTYADDTSMNEEEY